MKAIQIKQYGGAEQLQMADVPKPSAAQGQLVIRVAATTFNPIDQKLTSGQMRQISPLQFPFIPGVDFSGVVDSVGEGVKDFKPGDEVFGYSPTAGAYAEFIAIGADKVALKPKRLSHIEAASLAVVAQTASQMLDRAGVQKGQTVLIHGAGGAVGSVAVQLAHRRGATVIGTASAASLDRVKSYGADKVIDYATTPFENVVKDADAVLDAVGGEVQQRSFNVLKPGGVLVSIVQPPSEEQAAKHKVKASMLVTEASAANLQAIARMADAGELKPFIGNTYPLSEVERAWVDARTKRTDGKTVFTIATAAPATGRTAAAGDH